MLLEGKRNPLPDDLRVHRAFEAHAARAPEQTALNCDDFRLSYRELNERANQFAHYLMATGVGVGSLVGVCLDRTPALIVSILGILKAGAAYIPLDPAYPAERLCLMVGQMDSIKVNVVSAQTRDLIIQAPGELVLIDELGEALAQQSAANPDVAISNGDLCYAVFTSGSTGTPKATAIRHRGWYNLLEWLRVEYRLDSGSSGLTVSAFGFDISQRGLMAPLFCGAALHLLPSRWFDPSMAYRIIEEQGVRQLHCAPSTLYVLIEHEDAVGGDALMRVGHVFIGGEPLNVPRVEAWATRDGNSCVLLHQYGVAECTDVATSHELTDYPRYRTGPTPVGTPVYNTAIHILDEHGEPTEAPAGETGEICISGLSVSAGYLNASDRDISRFTQISAEHGPVPLYRTGDRGYITADGELVVVGRMDAQVKIRGMRIDLGDVEHGVRSHELVSDAVILALPDATGELSLVAFVIPADNTFEPQRLYQDLTKVLPRNMVPQRFINLSEFPLSPNGKKDRKRLEEILQDDV
jgi:D-alanine--poly(phosphoribitol) ligase subunit 1